jgi:hypothetical protein
MRWPRAGQWKPGKTACAVPVCLRMSGFDLRELLVARRASGAAQRRRLDLLRPNSAVQWHRSRPRRRLSGQPSAFQYYGRPSRTDHAGIQIQLREQ